ncbi:hypothetical protein M3649_03630 [Ureibacillus chungkukjangi]|uniref:hypothetical protein n=1 Tax=Ureibacillus chungkukjangi TaxID=1202712 RepID=UPI00203C3E1A|nr:hypothetical protein [Ureibacillus chungkukjangi]MCM3387221.1 hypothetical protein [Ureibacillus chungkukjangi]
MSNGTVLVNKEDLTFAAVEESLFGYKLIINTLDENGNLNEYKTIPMTEGLIMKDWRYATNDEIA